MRKIYYFGADWCSQCSALFPRFDNFCKDNNIKYEYIDADCNDDLCGKMCIKNLPTIIIEQDDKIIFRGHGFDGFNSFIQFHSLNG